MTDVMQANRRRRRREWKAYQAFEAEAKRRARFVYENPGVWW